MAQSAGRGDRPDRLRAWSRDADELLAELGVDPAIGLDDAEVLKRRMAYGPNLLPSAARRHIIAILFEQFRSLVILLLVAAGILAILFAEFVEGIAIFAVVGIATAMGFVSEWRATRSMEALRRLGRVESVVIRGGVTRTVPADELVPGDIVVREGGDIVTADLRLLEAAKLQADESTLTGESLPVDKQVDTLPHDTVLMERSNMLFKGTSLTRGSCKGVVVGTGLATELGRITRLATEAESQVTPLEKRLDALAGRLVWVVLVLAAIVAAAGLAAGRDMLLAIEVAIALAVAAIPEGLPVVATIALARGMWRMAKRNALISKLSAVETLGATGVILSDKTGTLTENRMTVTSMVVQARRVSFAGTLRRAGMNDSGHTTEDDIVDDILRTGALCSNATLQTSAADGRGAIGDPTEVALLVAGSRRGLDASSIRQANPEHREYAFDPQAKLMATVHHDPAGALFAVKGAPEALIPLCSRVAASDGPQPLRPADARRWLDEAHALGAHGLRALGVATKFDPDIDASPWCNLTLLGLVGMEDPPRHGVKQAISRCTDAGIAVVMVTGDHQATARNVAIELGIVDDAASDAAFVTGDELSKYLDAGDHDRLLAARVFSRVTPEQKLRLIEMYQAHDQVVAMTGDGVNDAPALKRADIGVAMGRRGTAVAREAAAMVLRDDEFGTIVEAVAQGRSIYENIRKFVVYLLSCNISEVMVVSIATFAGAPLPLLPLQILFLNLVTDVFPALALGVGEGSERLMEDPPRPAREPVLTRRHWIEIGIYGALISAAVLGSMAIAILSLGHAPGEAVTISFCTLSLAQLWHVFNMRRSRSSFIDNEVVRNPWIWAALLLCMLLIAVAVYWPPASDILSLAPPTAQGWTLIVTMSLLPVFLGPLVRRLSRRHVDPVSPRC